MISPKKGVGAVSLPASQKNLFQKDTGGALTPSSVESVKIPPPAGAPAEAVSGVKYPENIKPQPPKNVEIQSFFKQKLKSHLGRGELFDPSGKPLTPDEFLATPPAQGGFKTAKIYPSTSLRECLW